MLTMLGCSSLVKILAYLAAEYLWYDSYFKWIILTAHYFLFEIQRYTYPNAPLPKIYFC